MEIQTFIIGIILIIAGIGLIYVGTVWIAQAYSPYPVHSNYVIIIFGIAAFFTGIWLIRNALWPWKPKPNTENNMPDRLPVIK